MNRKKVRVEGAPGFASFDAWHMLTLSPIDDRGLLIVVVDDDDEVHVIPSKHVTYVTPPKISEGE